MQLGFENETMEFKESLAEKEEAMKDMGAMLNKRGGGTLYFGVRNDGEVLGMTVGKRSESDIADKINSSIEPSPYYEINTRVDPEGKAFIEVSFQGNERPYRVKGGYYIRNGERSDVMSPSLLAAMFLQIQATYDRWESSPSECALADMDEELVKAVIDKGNELNRLQHPYVDLMDALSFLHLLTPDKKINKAGEMLFSRNKPISFRVSALGDDAGKNYIDMQRVSGNIFECISFSYDYILSHLDFAPRHGSGVLERDMRCEIPQLSIRELIVNAFGHAYYGAPSSHDFAIYPNRVAIYSPGPFPLDVTPEEFAAKEIKPVDKNDRINNVLYFYGYIEHFGTGFTKIFDLFMQERISYSYQNVKGGFLFVTYRPGKVHVDEEASDYRKLLGILTQNRYCSIEELASLLQKSKATINRMIAELKAEGKLERIGSDRDGYYLVR